MSGNTHGLPHGSSRSHLPGYHIKAQDKPEF